MRSGSGNLYPQSMHCGAAAGFWLPHSGHNLIGASPLRWPDGSLPLTASTGPISEVVSVKSAHRQSVLPGARRIPRPAICTYSTGLLVARSSAMKSSSGTSKPVVSTATLTRHRSLPARKSAIRAARCALGVSALTISTDTLRRRSASHTWPACSIVTANTSHRLRSLASCTISSHVASTSSARSVTLASSLTT